MTNLYLDRTTINMQVCHDKPTIRGKRYPVERMLELLSFDMTKEELLLDYADLEKEDFLACFAYTVNKKNY